MSTMKHYKIEDCFRLRARIGWQGLRAEEFIDHGPYLVTGTDFVNGKIDWETCYHVDEYRYNQDKGIQLRENDLLVTKDGTVGKTAFVVNCPEKATLNSHIFLVRAINSNVVPAYLYYVLNSHVFDVFLRNILTGTTIKGLTQENFYKFTFVAPDAPRQSKIAEILTTVDETIDKTRAMIEKYTKIKAGMMQDLLSNGEEIPLSQLCIIISGSTPPTTEEFYWNGSNVWITPNDLSNLTMPYISTSTRKLTDQGVKKATRTLLSAYSVIISNRAPVGYCAIVTVPFTFNQGCKGLVCYPDTDPLYIYYFLSWSTSQLEKVSSGTTFLELSKRELERFLIQIPKTLGEQKTVSGQILAADEKIQTERNYLAKLQEIKRGLMQDLLTNTVSVDALL